MPVGRGDGEEYLEAARERIGDAFVLLRAERLGGGIAVAGRAAEAGLRAVIWQADSGIRTGRKSLDTGHDLRRLLADVRNLGLLRVPARDLRMAADVQHVSRLWYNNLRYASSASVERRWRVAGEVTSRRPMKVASAEFFTACSQIVKRCEALCESTKP